MQLAKIENTNIYEFKASERPTEEDAQRMNESFKAFRANGEKIKLLGIIDQLPWPKNLKFVDEIIHLKSNSLHVLEKYAILSDKQSLEKWVSVGNFFTPSIPMKMFHKDDRQTAIDWLKQTDEKPYDPDNYLSNIGVEKLNDLTYKINISHVKMNEGAMKGLYNLIEEESSNKKLNIVVIFESFPSFDKLNVLVEGMMVDFESIGNVDKYAVVSDAKWIKSFAKLGDFALRNMNIKFFEMGQLNEAEKWVVND